RDHPVGQFEEAASRLVVCATMADPAAPRSPVAPPEGPGADPEDAGRPGQVPERRRSLGRLRPPTPRVALLLATGVVVLAALFLGREALSPFIVGLLVVYLLEPPVARLTRLGLRRSLAILVVYGLTAF